MRDYKLIDKSSHFKRVGRVRFSGMHWLLLGVVIAVLASTIVLMPNNAAATRSTISSDPVSIEKNTLTVPAVDTSKLPLLPSFQNKTSIMLQEHRIRIKRGDNMSKIFSRLGVSARELHNILQLDKAARLLTELKPGQELTLRIDEHQRVHDLLYQINTARTLHISLRGGVYLTTVIDRELNSRINYASGQITNSLFEDASKAGLSDNLIMELVAIFGWDIDFALDIRQGDRFSLMYEEQFLDGKKVKNGSILAAEFSSRGKTYQAIRYTDADGRTDYYSPNGRSMRKAFLRTPVDFKRISSRFGKRKHPILNTIRDHKGVDYAAPRGTPIRATGDGRIVYKGRKGGYGRSIIIKHGGKYSTLYAHMNSYRRGIRKGSYVGQGDIIGYVGSSGRATGSHLHYEFRVHGAHKNPLTVSLPAANPINKKFKADFLNKSDKLLVKLEQFNNNTIALNQ